MTLPGASTREPDAPPGLRLDLDGCDYLHTARTFTRTSLLDDPTEWAPNKHAQFPLVLPAASLLVASGTVRLPAEARQGSVLLLWQGCCLWGALHHTRGRRVHWTASRVTVASWERPAPSQCLLRASVIGWLQSLRFSYDLTGSLHL